MAGFVDREKSTGSICISYFAALLRIIFEHSMDMASIFHRDGAVNLYSTQSLWYLTPFFLFLVTMTVKSRHDASQREHNLRCQVRAPLTESPP